LPVARKENNGCSDFPMNLESFQMTPLGDPGGSALFAGRRLSAVRRVVGLSPGCAWGRKHFWESELSVLIAGIGILAALLAIVLQKVAVAWPGAWGGLAAIQIASALSVTGAASRWIFFWDRRRWRDPAVACL
jgi:hypothetical protein